MNIFFFLKMIVENIYLKKTLFEHPFKLGIHVELTMSLFVLNLSPFLIYEIIFSSPPPLPPPPHTPDCLTHKSLSTFLQSASVCTCAVDWQERCRQHDLRIRSHMVVLCATASLPGRQFLSIWRDWQQYILQHRQLVGHQQLHKKKGEVQGQFQQNRVSKSESWTSYRLFHHPKLAVLCSDHGWPGSL